LYHEKSVKNPFFSIILATYNRAHLLPRALGSVFSQDYADWELLVVDDGSVDATENLIRDYQNQDARVQYLKKSHSGLAKTRNAGISQAKGNYVTFLDSDDEYLAGHLSCHAAFLEEHPEAEMIHGKVEVIGDPNVPDARDTSKTIPISECTQPGTFFIQRELLNAMGGFPIVEFGEDSALLSRMEREGRRLLLSPFQSYRYYNDEPDSMCNQLKAKGKL